MIQPITLITLMLAVIVLGKADGRASTMTVGRADNTILSAMVWTSWVLRQSYAVITRPVSYSREEEKYKLAL